MVLILMVAGCVQAGPGTPQSGEKATSPIGARLAIEGIPSLNNEVSLRLTATSEIDVPDVDVEIKLPDTFELVDGSLSWSGAMVKDQSVELEAAVRPKSLGECQIDGYAQGRLFDEQGEVEAAYGETDILYISVEEESGTSSHEPLSPPPVSDDKLTPIDDPLKDITIN